MEQETVKSKMNLTPADDLVDEVWGKKGTPERDAMEARLEEDLQVYFIGEAIKEARLKQHLTQEELGRRAGIKRTQICKLERGKSPMPLSTLSRVFKALGIATATLDLGIGGKIALW